MRSNHQHNAPFGLCEHVGVAAHDGIDLVGCDGLSVFACVELFAVYHLGNLLGAHSAVLACKTVEYGFFYFHVCKILLSVLIVKRSTKKGLLLLCLPSKCSFTLSKLRFFGLRTPKNNSFYSTSRKKWVTYLLLGHPLLMWSLFVIAVQLPVPDRGLPGLNAMSLCFRF